MEEARIHTHFGRRYKTQDGGHVEVDINLSGIRQSDSDDFILRMLDRADFATQAMQELVETRLSGIAYPAATGSSARTSPPDNRAPAVAPKRGLFEPEVTVSAIVTPAVETKQEDIKPVLPIPVNECGIPYDPLDTGAADATGNETKTLDSSKYSHDPFQGDKTFIPEDSEIKIGSEAFGVKIAWPSSDLIAKPISEINSNGEGGGQMRALNTGLSAIGCKGTDRHRACEEILEAYGEIHTLPVRKRVESIRDLTGAEASVCLEWIAGAEELNIQALLIAMGAIGTGVVSVVPDEAPTAEREGEECLI